MDRGTARNM